MQSENNFKLPFSAYLSKIKGWENEELYKINSCKFNNQDITQEIKIINEEVQEDEEIEDIRFIADYNFRLNPGLNKIEIKTKTIVPITDNIYAHTITIPCKRYSVNFTVHNLDYDVQGYAFAFENVSKEKLEKLIYRDKYDNCYKIRFEDWTLPGDGTIFIINKKKKEN